MEPEELARLLEKLNRKMPEIYRHVVGIVRKLLKEPSPEHMKKKEEENFLRQFRPKY